MAPLAKSASGFTASVFALGSSFRRYRGPFCLVAAGMLLDAAFTVCRPWPLKVVIDLVLSEGSRPSRVPLLGKWLTSAVAGVPSSRILIGACVASGVIALATGTLTYLYTRRAGEIALRSALDLRCRLFAHLQRLSLEFHDGQRTGDLVTRLTSDVQSIQEAMGNGVIVLGSNIALLAGMLGMMFWINWRFSLYALAAAPLLFWTLLHSTRQVKVAARRARDSTGALASLAQESLASIRIVQGLAQEEQQNSRFAAQGKIGLGAQLEGIRYQARVAPLVDVLAAVGLVVVMWFGTKSVLAGSLTTGDVVVFFAYVTNLYSPMRALARVAGTFNRAAVSVERITDVLAAESRVVDRPRARELDRAVGAIEFRDVSFEYLPGQPVLSHVSFHIAPGERVALVGTTGAGKSTLASLLSRFYDPTEGAVLIDGEDIRSCSINSLREQISMVLQESLLFSGTIRENIAFGRSPRARWNEVTLEEDIVAAAAAANADEFIRRMPEGYSTRVSERGATLSGGQRQRLAIARAIVRDAPILILDEPTSSLDAVSERVVVDALERAAAGRTTLIIAHRLSTLRFVDRIVVLEQGQVIEQGTHATLLARGGRYSTLYRLQHEMLDAAG